jgi:trimeric autotransporter adhesin
MGLAGCTDVVDRTQITIAIDGAANVREATVTLETVVESQFEPGRPWELQRSSTYERDSLVWPLRDRITRSELGGKVRLKATARALSGGVVAEARVIRDVSSARSLALEVRFDAACFQPADVCAPAETCRAGDCVSAQFDPNLPPVEDGATEPDAPGAADSGPREESRAVASEGSPCGQPEARSCAGYGSSRPLRCSGSSWTLEPECPIGNSCDTSDGATRGTCQPNAPECQGRELNTVFCDAEERMKICVDLVSANPIACGEQEHCVDMDGAAMCVCKTGFTKVGLVCKEASECGQDEGGCDPPTRCSMQAGQRVCSACPTGYLGRGETGCEPTLTELRVTPGELAPDFDPEQTEYRIEVGLHAQRVMLTAKVPDGASLEIDGGRVVSGEAWVSPLLPLGEMQVTAIATSASGTSRSYSVFISRMGRQDAYIKAREPSMEDEFAVSIAASGDTLVAGALYEDSNATGVDGDQNDEGAYDSGAAYVFARGADGWRQQAYLKSSETASEDFFGFSVAISGDTIAVGAVRNDPLRTPTRPGVVYVFSREGERWSQTDRLTPMSSSAGDLFGYSLAFEGDTLVATAPGDDEGGTQSGAAYVFERQGGRWVELARLKPQPLSAASAFGSAVAISGDSLIVSAMHDSVEETSAGSAYVYERRSGAWVEAQQIRAPNPRSGANFGFSVAIDGSLLGVGAPIPDPVRVTPAGSAYVFERVAGAWTLSAELQAPIPRDSDYFGAGIAVHGGLLLIGASGDASPNRGIAAAPGGTGAPYAGAAYLFARDGERWLQSAILKPANAERDQAFGYVVLLTDEFAAVGAHFEDNGAGGIEPEVGQSRLSTSGALYVFE